MSVDPPSQQISPWHWKTSTPFPGVRYQDYPVVLAASSWNRARNHERIWSRQIFISKVSPPCHHTGSGSSIGSQFSLLIVGVSELLLFRLQLIGGFIGISVVLGQILSTSRLRSHCRTHLCTACVRRTNASYSGRDFLGVVERPIVLQEVALGSGAHSETLQPLSPTSCSTHRCNAP